MRLQPQDHKKGDVQKYNGANYIFDGTKYVKQ